MLDATDRKLIAATQGGLPLVQEPFAQVAEWLGIGEDEVIRRFEGLKSSGVLRRIAIAPNHYALGTSGQWHVRLGCGRCRSRTIGR